MYIFYKSRRFTVLFHPPTIHITDYRNVLYSNTDMYRNTRSQSFVFMAFSWCHTGDTEAAPVTSDGVNSLLLSEWDHHTTGWGRTAHLAGFFFTYTDWPENINPRAVQSNTTKKTPLCPSVALHYITKFSYFSGHWVYLFIYLSIHQWDTVLSNVYLEKNTFSYRYISRLLCSQVFFFFFKV